MVWELKNLLNLGFVMLDFLCRDKIALFARKVATVQKIVQRNIRVLIRVQKYV